MLVALTFILSGCSLVDDVESAVSDLGLGSLAGFDVVYKQNWGHYCCVQENDYDTVYSKTLSQQQTYHCDDYTNECKIEIKNTDTGSWTVNSQGFYSISGQASTWYNLEVGKTKVFTIKKGEYVVFRKGATVFGEKDTKITKYVKSFYIQGQENGKVYRQESCVLNSALKRLTLTDGLNELSKSGLNQCQNYMTDFVKVATETYTYNNKEVICQARQLYTIDNQEFKDGATRKVQGERLASVACCPAEPNCNSNTFKFDVNVIKECTYDSQCPNGGSPIATAGNQFLTYDCISGKCVMSEPQFVECTNTAQCILTRGEGYVCDLAPATWGQCKKATGSGYCGDGVCSTVNSENIDTCPDDCLGQTAWWVYLLVGLGFFAVFMFLRPSLRKIPYIGKYLP